jgi:integrase
MGRRRTLTDSAIAALPSKPKPYALPDPELPGHYIRVRPTGAKVFCAVGRAPSGKQIWHTIGATSLYNVTEARERAREAIKAIRDGKDRDGPETFETVAEAWFKRHVEAKRLISASTFRSALDRHFLPAWRMRDFASIRRGDVAKLLDAIEDSNGPAAADYALTVIRMVCNWYAARRDDYVSPVVRGMRRTDPKAQARARILDDDEIRAVWKAAEANGTFGAYVRLALLTAQRREKVAAMRWDDISEGEWRIPAEARQKGTAGCLVLPEIAMEIIKEQPRFASNPYVLAGRGSGYIQGQSKRKEKFDAKVGIAPWVFHDLRRTARSLMSRAGVRPDVAERVMGHSIRGVEGVYDRHSYRDEKADALNRLAALIETIVNTPVGNVVTLRESNSRQNKIDVWH